MSRSHLDALFADLPPRLDVPQIADLLGVSHKAVYTWLNNGILPGYQVGRTWIVLRDDVKAALTAGSNTAARLFADDQDPPESDDPTVSEPPKPPDSLDPAGPTGS